ncbi:MAG: ammonium transporter [Candidatus Hydrogenedentota bacterium]|nr:MAG: ammonium transporter [Candidatus Hydrogenedentota bacterium]
MNQVYAQEEAVQQAPQKTEVKKPSATDELAYAVDNMFLFFCAVLVLFMQAGFAMVEAGLNASKNTVNILFKNLMDLCIGVGLYWLIGYGMMYPGDAFKGGWFGFAGFGVSEKLGDVAGGTLHPQFDFLFQVAFAATAATIVSGAVAGRLKFAAYLIYSAVLTGLIYPISGMWKWGGGWLDAMGFYDFAGSLVVHAVGGFAGLAGALVLGPRIGKFNQDGTPNPMPGHNLAFTALGVFILWIGWYGFNPGSQLAFYGSANTSAVGIIAVNTTIAAAMGAFGAMLFNWILYGKPELSMALNGALAGLVGITANCDSVTNGEAFIIGIVAGIIVVLGVILLNKLKIDDPVGAFPVHGLAGIWGGIATGLFGDHPLGAQIVGSLVIPAWAFITMYILFFTMDKIFGIRVSEEEEIKGLDIGEHGEEAYAGFQIIETK